MTTAAVLAERAKAIGLPIAKNAFAGTVDEPVPPLPYLVYLLPHEKGRGADDVNNLKEQDFDLELYTADDDTEREEIAQRIENEVLFDVEYDVFLAPVDGEDCYQTAWEITGLLKKTKGVNTP